MYTAKYDEMKIFFCKYFSYKIFYSYKYFISKQMERETSPFLSKAQIIQKELSLQPYLKHLLATCYFYSFSRFFFVVWSADPKSNQMHK